MQLQLSHSSKTEREHKQSPAPLYWWVVIKAPIAGNPFQHTPLLEAFGVLILHLPTQALGSRSVLLFLFCPWPHRCWMNVYVKVQLQRKAESLLLLFSRILSQPVHDHIPLEGKTPMDLNPLRWSRQRPLSLPLPKKPSGCYRKERTSPLLFTTFFKRANLTQFGERNGISTFVWGSEPFP